MSRTDSKGNESSRVISFSEESLREWFAQYDEDGTGIDHSGFQKLCEHLGIEPHLVPKIMVELDGDQDGKINFEDVYSKFGSHYMDQTDVSKELKPISELPPSPASPDTNETQQFFTPTARMDQLPQTTDSVKGKPIQSTPLRSSLIYNRKRFGRWSFSGAPSQLKSPQGGSRGEGDDIQFLSPIASSPQNSRPNSSHDNYPDLTAMMSPFVEPTSPRHISRRGSQVSDDGSLWEDPGSLYGTAISGEPQPTPKDAWSNKKRSQSVGSPPVMSTPRQGSLTFCHIGPLEGLKQLLSPNSKGEESFFVPFEGVMEELDNAGIVNMEEEKFEDFETVLKEMNLVSDGMVNLRSLLSTMDQCLSTEGEGTVYSIMKQIALKAYKSEIQLLRKQVGELNIEKETLRLSVSRMVEDKDKMATEVDIHQYELHEQMKELLMKKQTKYEERIREIECYYQNEMESIRQNAKNQIAHLEQEKEKRMTEEEKMKDEVKGWKTEVEALQDALDLMHHKFESKEAELEALLRVNSEHLDMIQLAEENETLKAKLKELNRGEKLEELAQLEEQCKDLKDRIDELQSALETAQADSKKYRRKTHILRQRETRLKEENQKLRESKTVEDASSQKNSPDIIRTLQPSNLSTISLDLPYDDHDDDLEFDDQDEDIEDDEGVERTEDALSDAEEKSLKGEMHDLELQRAKRSILKLSNAKVKLTRDLELLQTEYQHLKDEEETKRDILQKKLEEKSEEAISLRSDLSSVKRDLENAQQAVDQMKDELEQTRFSHASQLQELEQEVEHCKMLIQSQQKTISSLEEEVHLTESLKSDLADSQAMSEDHQLSLEYKDQIQCLRDELREEQEGHREEVDNLKNELKSALQKNAQLKEECSALEETISDQKEKLRKSEVTFKEMTGEIQKWMQDSQLNLSRPREENLKVLEETKRQLEEAVSELEHEKELHRRSEVLLEEDKQSLKRELVQSEEKCKNLDEARTNLKMEVDSFMEEVSELKRQLDFLTQSKAEAAEQYEAEIDRYRAMSDAASILQKENQMLHQQVVELTQQVEDVSRQIEQVRVSQEEELKKLQDEQESLMSKLLRAETDLNDKSQKLKQLQEDKDALCVGKDEEIQELKQRVSELETQMDQEEIELNESQKENLKLESSLGRLESDYEKQKITFEAKSSAWKEDIRRLTSKVSELESEMEEQKTESASTIADLESQLSKSLAEKYSIEKDLLSLRAELKSTEEQFQEERVKLEEDQSKELKSQKDAFDQERLDLQDQVKNSSSKLQEAFAEVSDMKRSLSEEKMRYDSLLSANKLSISEKEKMFADKMAALQHKIEMLSGKIEEQDQEVSRLETCIAEEKQQSMEQESKWLKKESEYLTATAKLKARLEDVTKQQEDDMNSFKLSLLQLEKQLTDKESEVEKLSKLREECDDDLRCVQEELKRTAEELKVAKTEGQSAVARLEAVWESRVCEWDTSRAEYQSQLASTKEQVSSLKQQLSESVPASEASEYVNRIAKLTDQLKDKEDTLTAKTNAVAELTKELKDKEEEWHQIMDTLGAQVDKMSMEVKQQSSYVVNLRKELAEERSNNSVLLQEMEAMKTLVEEGESEKETREELNSLRSTMAQRESELQDEIRKKQSLIHTLEMSVEAKEDIISEKQRKIAKLSSRVESLEGEMIPDLPGLEDSPLPSPVNVGSLAKELHKERRLSQELLQQIDNLQASFSSALDREQHSSSIVAELESELSMLKEKEDSSNSLVRDLRQKLAHSEATIGELSSDLESFRTTLEERDEGYEERVENYRQRMSELEEYVEELKSQNQATSKQFEELVEYNGILEDDNHMLQEELERVQADTRMLKDELETYADQKEIEIAQLKEKLSGVEFSLAERELCNPAIVHKLEDELKRQKELLAEEQEKVRQLTHQLNNEDVPYVIEEEESVDTSVITLVEHEEKVDCLRREHEKSMGCLQEEVTNLKAELQGLQKLLNTKSISLDDSIDDASQLRQQLREVDNEKDALSKKLKKVHQKEMVELADLHSREVKKMLHEKRELEEKDKQRENIISQLLQQTMELDEGKTRLSKVVRELREERESLLHIIENLANKVTL